MTSQAMAATYLNDHLAGSTAAIELLKHLVGSDIDPSAKSIAGALLEEIRSERPTLKELIARMDAAPSVARQAASWLSEKAARLKLVVDDPGKDVLHLLEAAEALSLGIEGKRLLWRVLLKASEVEPRLVGPNYGELIRQAESQRDRIESVRLSAAEKMFG